VTVALKVAAKKAFHVSNDGGTDGLGVQLFSGTTLKVTPLVMLYRNMCNTTILKT